MADVGLIDYRAGNIQSLSNALEYVGAEVRLLRAGDTVDGLSHLVLPGVGAFGYCAQKLRAAGMLPMLEDWVLVQKRPILGICVGMQLLADASEESPHEVGLGWIGGEVRKLERTDPAVRIPHVGWNTVRFDEDFGGFARGAEADFYFDHSYAYRVPRQGHTLGECVHGQVFSAAVRRGNIVGAQFHPEKSQASGLRFLESFLAL